MSVCDVVIVGAGPTGLMLAVELQRRGVKVRLFEKLIVPSDKSKALAIQARSMEIFDVLGLSEQFANIGFAATGGRIFVKGKQAVELELSELKLSGTKFPSIFIVSQADTERILSEKFVSLGGVIERGCEVLSFEMDESNVKCTVRLATGSSDQVTAKFIAGCDGAHSMVRHTLGIEFEGAAYHQRFLLADAKLDWELPAKKLDVFFGDTGACVILPFRDRNKVRVIVADHKSDSDGEVTKSEVEDAMQYHMAQPVKLSHPVWLARFHLHHRVANRYQFNRAFLVGDAAHIHSPAGGQGMNTGIQDAFNLGWKIASYLRKPNLQLLNSYEVERRPVGLELLRRTDRMFTVASSDNIVLCWLRNQIAVRVVPRLIKSDRFRAAMFQFVSQLGIRYEPSLFVTQDLSRAPRGFSTAKLLGRRVPNAEDRIHDLLKKGAGFHVLLIGTGSKTWQDAAHKQLIPVMPHDSHIHAVAPTPTVKLLFGAVGPCIYVVRPDGHVGFRSYGEGLQAVCRYFQI